MTTNSTITPELLRSTSCELLARKDFQLSRAFKAKAKNRSACRRSASLDIVALSSADCSLLMLRAGSGN
jgi:hypothetical protein